jgi:hypothetical protein
MARTYTADMFPASVVVPGSARMVENQFIGDASTTFGAGDLIRINTSGQVKLAATDSDTTGPVHGMILTNDYASTAPAATALVPVWLFGDDTVIRLQVYNATAGDAEPQDVTIGVAYTLRRGSAGIWSVTTTTTKGVATVVAKPSNVQWFVEESAAGQDYGIVDIRFTAAQLQAYGA